MTTPFRTQCEEDVLLAARRYGRMKAFGAAVEHDVDERGVVSMRAKVNQDMHAETLLAMLGAAAVKLVLSMTVDEVEGKLIE